MRPVARSAPKVLVAKEAELGFRLAESYRNFLLTTANAGTIVNLDLDNFGVGLWGLADRRPDLLAAPQVARFWSLALYLSAQLLSEIRGVDQEEDWLDLDDLLA